MPDKWSTICLATTCFWIWFLLGYSVFAIAYASYGMGIAQGVQCRHNLDYNTVWVTDTTTGTSLCDYLFSHHNDNHNGNTNQNHEHVGDEPTTTIALKAQCHAELKARIATAVPKLAGELKCSNSIFAFPAPWNRAFWAGIALFACYWILFGWVLESMTVDACRDVSDEVKEMDDGSREHGDVIEKGVWKEGRYTGGVICMGDIPERSC